MFKYKGTCQIFAGKEIIEKYDYFEEDDLYHMYKCEYKWELLIEEEIFDIMKKGLSSIGFICESIEIKILYENTNQYLIECICSYPTQIVFDEVGQDFYIKGIPSSEFDLLDSRIKPSVEFIINEYIE